MVAGTLGLGAAVEVTAAAAAVTGSAAVEVTGWVAAEVRAAVVGSAASNYFREQGARRRERRAGRGAWPRREGGGFALVRAGLSRDVE